MLSHRNPETHGGRPSRSFNERVGRLITMTVDDDHRRPPFDSARWNKIFDQKGINPEFSKTCRQQQNDVYARPNLELNNHAKGPVSQAHGWLMIALDRAQVELTNINQIEHYNGDPVEQALFWLVSGFGLKTDVVEIGLIIDHLRAGRIQIAADCLEEYMLI